MKPDFIRLPKKGASCPYTGFKRGSLRTLCIPSKANGFKPAVPAKCLRQPGNLRGIWLIPYGRLIAYLEGLPTPGLRDATEDETPARLSRDSVVNAITPPVQPVRITAGIEEVRVMLNCRSTSATYRELKKLGVSAYSPGKYRIACLENAVARASYNAARRAQRREASALPFGRRERRD